MRDNLLDNYDICRRAERIYLLPLLLIIISLSLAPRAYAAASEGDSLRPAPTGSPDILDTIWTDIEESTIDAYLLFSSPVRFSLRDWGTFGWIVAGTGMSTVADDPMRRLFRRRSDTIAVAFADFGTFYGSWVPAVGIFGALYAGGLIFDEPGVRRAGRHVIQAALYATVITTTLKVVIGRQRPFPNEGPYVFDGPSFKDVLNSLPSGHSSLSFAISSSLAADIDNPWATVGLYGIAAATALSRIYVDRHWLSDTFLGAAIGIACGYGVNHLHDGDGGDQSFLILPMHNGIAMSWRF